MEPESTSGEEQGLRRAYEPPGILWEEPFAPEAYSKCQFKPGQGGCRANPTKAVT
jgi:hypothetical protein